MILGDIMRTRYEKFESKIRICPECDKAIIKGYDSVVFKKNGDIVHRGCYSEKDE